MWERKLEFIGSVIELVAHNGGAVRHRSQKASSGFLQLEITPVQPEVVTEGAGESVWSQHSLECHVVEWLLDVVKAARTGIGILVCSSLESDGRFQAGPSRRLRHFLEKAAPQRA